MAEVSETEPLLDPDCRDGKCGSCIGGPCEHWCHAPAPERTPPDDATENLRERIAWLRDRWYQRPGLSEQADALDAALDEFAKDAGDPGDLPARMAEAIANTVCDHVEVGAACSECRAAAALSVRWEDHAATVAENAQLRARTEHTEAELSSRIEQHQRAVNRATAAEAEVERLRAELAESERVRAKLGADHRRLPGRARRREPRARPSRAGQAPCAPHGRRHPRQPGEELHLA
jgi:hypothetical protein